MSGGPPNQSKCDYQGNSPCLTIKQCRIMLMYKPIDPVQNGSTALHVAANNGHLKVVEMLLAAKCQVDLQDKVSVSASLSIRVTNSVVI